MKNSENRFSSETLKLAVMVILSYLVPVFGMAFSAYVLIYSKTHRVERWLRKLAVVSLILQLLIVAMGVVGWATWVIN
ncbi:MAG: hypothetical protein JJU16_00915 [Alkalibacterium sp.]|nr:hypothetical protein [Alkalibacterium sp.]